MATVGAAGWRGPAARAPPQSAAARAPRTSPRRTAGWAAHARTGAAAAPAPAPAPAEAVASAEAPRAPPGTERLGTTSRAGAASLRVLPRRMRGRRRSGTEVPQSGSHWHTAFVQEDRNWLGRSPFARTPPHPLAAPARNPLCPDPAPRSGPLGPAPAPPAAVAAASARSPAAADAPPAGLLLSSVHARPATRPASGSAHPPFRSDPSPGIA
mmetsp:Transcript_145921/g.406479  ORF Transcript_145921/g.406479 Transcript_145921/m.406479 type:complete len:212 (+) Transcript_145921:743-1378(+)